jgi:hypothetical protein
MGVVDEDRGTTCLVRSGADDKDLLMAGWPTTSREENKIDDEVELKRRRGLVMAVST